MSEHQAPMMYNGTLRPYMFEIYGSKSRLRRRHMIDNEAYLT